MIFLICFMGLSEKNNWINSNIEGVDKVHPSKYNPNKYGTTASAMGTQNQNSMNQGTSNSTKNPTVNRNESYGNMGCQVSKEGIKSR